MELARGAVRDQPWGLTLGALAQRATTGELTIVDGATRVTLVLEDGRVVAGQSTRTAPSLLERAARSFELVNATFVLDSEITLLRREPSAAIDLREIIFTGARRYVDDDRLHAELRQLGTRFSLGPGGVAELPRYGADVPTVIAATLRDGASIAEVEVAHPEVDRRAIQALVYALVSCGAGRGLLPARAPTPPPDGGRTPTPGGSRTITPGGSRTITPNSARTISPNSARTITPNSARTITPNTGRTTTPNTGRTTTPSTGRTTTPEGVKVPSANDSGQALLARIPTVNVARNPTPPSARTTTTRDPIPPRTATTKDAIPAVVTEPVRSSPKPARSSHNEDVDLSRTHTRRDPSPFDEPAKPAKPPAKRAAIALPDEYTRPNAIRTGPSSRATPSHGVRIMSPDDDAKTRAAHSAERARRLLDAHEYLEAQREALAATRLVPESFDYQALHAWATFCGARDKAAAADATRKLLEKASHRASAPHEVRLLLGRLERTVGREREALRHFRAVIEREPNHAEATVQIRELEAQLEAFARR